MNKYLLGWIITAISFITIIIYLFIILNSGKTLFIIDLLKTRTISKSFEFKSEMNPLRLKIKTQGYQFYYSDMVRIDISIKNTRNKVIYTKTFRIKRDRTGKSSSSYLSSTLYSTTFKIPQAGTYILDATATGDFHKLHKLELELKYNVSPVDFKIIGFLLVLILIGIYLIITGESKR